MIPENKRKAIQTLYEEGKRKKEIARLFNLDPKTVRTIIAQEGTRNIQERQDKKHIDSDLLLKLYKRCDGYCERVHEILHEEHDITIGYSTLTRIIRDCGIGKPHNTRCHQVPDMPGEEMQHDTTVYTIQIGEKKKRVVCSGLYFRYSKMRYIKFYFNFNRFKMKCFFYEALTHFGFSATHCIIDNTNLAILYGTGNAAVFNPEMISFAKPYGFGWYAHEKGHANRKAGKERNFWTVETNFLPGRTFKTLDDLNRQGFEWATNRYAHRPLSRTRLIPVALFEEEKPYLIKLSDSIIAPYQKHERSTDQYGYAAFNANYYWTPGKSRPSVILIEYPSWITIHVKGEKTLRYDLPPAEIRTESYKPEGINTNPYQPRNRKKSSHEEEQKLRAMDDVCGAYLDFITSKHCAIAYKHQFIRNLYLLSRKLSSSLFIAAITRALTYHIVRIDALERIASLLLKMDLHAEQQTVSVDYEYEQRNAYKEGRFSEEKELSSYQEMGEDEKEK